MSAETIMRQIATELKGNAILRASSSAYSPVGSEGVGGGGSLESRQSEVERARTPQAAAGSSKSTTGGSADIHHKHGRNDQGGMGPMGIEQQQQQQEEEMLQTPKRPKKQSGSGSGGGQSSPTIKLDPPSWDTPLGQRSRARSGLEQQHKHPRTDSTEEDLFQNDLAPPTARVRTGDADNAAAAVGTSGAGVRDQLAVASRNVKYVVTDETAGPPVAAAGNETTASSMMASLFLCCSSYEQADSSAAGQQTNSETPTTTNTPGTSLDSNGGATGVNNSKVGEDAALLQRAMRGVNSSRTVSAPRRMGSSMAQSRADSMVALGTATTEEEEEQDEEGVERVVASGADQVDGSNNGASNGAVAVPEKKGQGGGSSSSLRGKLYRSMFKKQQQQTQSSSRASLKDNVTDVPSDGSASEGDASGSASGSHGILSLVNSRAAASIVDSPSDVSDGDGEEGPALPNGGLGGLGLYVTGPALGQFHDVIGSESLSGNRRELGGTYARYRMEQRYVECVLGNMDCVMPLHHHHELTNSDGSMRRSNQWDSTADLGNMAGDPIKGCCDNLDMIKGHGTALPENVCSEPAASTMKVRGPTYLADGIKVESDEAMFALLGVDNIFGDGVPHICAKEEGYLGRFRRCCREVGVRVPFLLVINFVLPWGNLSAYMYRPDGTDGGPYNASRSSSVPSERLWKAFLEGNDDYRNQRLKFIPKMIAAPWIVKKMVGSSPALIGQKIPTSYYGSVEDNYLEICLDVTRGPQIANTIATTVAGKSDAVTVDLGFLIEGVVDTAELPEQLLAVFRLHHVYMNVKKAFSEEKWAEEVKRRQRMRSGDDEEETADAEA